MTKQAVVYRQGDVWLYKITTGEYLNQVSGRGATKADPEKGLILAEGEATGHHHRIPESGRVELHPGREGVRLLDVSKGKPVTLVHEEHETLEIPAGQYEVRIQREYSPTERTRQFNVRD